MTDTSANQLEDQRGFAQDYGPRIAEHDEMIDADGSLRPHWQMFVSMLDDMGRKEMIQRWDQARKLIRENGITYNVYGDPNGLDRPWSFDLVPLLVAAASWRAAGDALAQRAKLLNLIAADLYGPANCVSLGLLPPDLIYANPSFLRPCHGIIPPRDLWLHLYAADLVRSADGRFRVLSDRTQAPSGAGYTLENRIVVSRVLPTAFRQCNVLRLAPFFITLRQTLASLAPAHRENPHVVLLTPGPYNETYFEHAYLARYLGYPLVQGNDLTVRDGKVFLKTLGGLQPVDVILRRVDDDFCDPLELYPQSFLGVPGLMQAIRDGQVAVANALGSGVLQSPALLPFLDKLCRHFLSEELQIPSVETWWCGEPQSLRYVIENLSRLVIKPAFPGRNTDPIFGEELSRFDLEQLADRIAARPTQYVAQEHVLCCSTPVFLNQQIQPRRFSVRAYLAAENESYTVMNGGMTRVTGSPSSLVVSLQKGGGSKDTWILADGPVHEVSLLPPSTQPLELSRGGGELPSRVADDLFWLGRYVQRAEAIVRVARCVFGRYVDQVDTNGSKSLQTRLRQLLGHSLADGNGADRDLASAILETTNPEGLKATLNSVHILARALRDRISADAWHILQSIVRLVADFQYDRNADQIAGVIQLLNLLVSEFLAFGGVVADSMTRGQAWRFLDMGQRLERSVAVSGLLRSTLIDVLPEESVVLDAVLEIADSSLTYRRRYLTRLEVPPAIDLLVADETNPRAVAFQLAAIQEHLNSLPCDATHPHRCPDRQLVLSMLTLVRAVDISHECKPVEGRRVGLLKFLDNNIDQLTLLAELIGQIYFTHAAVSRQQSMSQSERTE